EAGLETHVLEGGALRRFAPYLSGDLTGAAYCPGEGYANPFLVAPLYALRAVERGGVIRAGGGGTGVEAGVVGRAAVGGRRRGVGRRARGDGRALAPRPRDRAPRQRDRAAREAARAARAAHRSPADAEAGLERHVHHRRRLAVAARRAAGSLLDDLGERGRER